MKPKAIAKMLIDFLMTILMICLMAYQITGEMLHEWIGIGIFILFITHHALNVQWYKRFTRSGHSADRVIGMAVDLFMLATMLGLMISSLILSQFVFSFLSIHNGMAFARVTHLLCSYWGFVLMSLHLGFHWGMISGMMKKALCLKKTPTSLKISSRIIGLIVAGFGIYGFITEHIAEYLFLRTQFVMFDYEASPISILAKYIAIMILFAAIAYYGSKLLQRVGSSLKKTKKS